MKMTCIVALSALSALVGRGMLPDDPPPLRLYLEQGNERVDVRIDKPFELTVGGETVSLTLRAHPTRILDIGSVRFEYPKDYVYEFDDETDGVEMWTVEGSESLCMLHRYSIPFMNKAGVLDMIIRATEDQLGNHLTKEPCEVALGGLKLEGTRLEIAIGDIRVLQDFYLLPTTGTETVVLILQDTIDVEIGERQTEGFRRLLELLDKTLQVVK